jgi:pimeloyl-ACP methyl ester carboxylesterase
MDDAPRISLVGVLQNITVPFLITHGANDRQIPLECARSYTNRLSRFSHDPKSIPPCGFGGSALRSAGAFAERPSQSHANLPC